MAKKRRQAPSISQVKGKGKGLKKVKGNVKVKGKVKGVKISFLLDLARKGHSVGVTDVVREGIGVTDVVRDAVAVTDVMREGVF